MNDHLHPADRICIDAGLAALHKTGIWDEAAQLIAHESVAELLEQRAGEIYAISLTIEGEAMVELNNDLALSYMARARAVRAAMDARTNHRENPLEISS